MMEITTDAGDDPAFIDIVAAFLPRLTAQVRPDALCVTKIDNWFDYKWLGYFHGIWKYMRGTIRRPPFAPKRVVSRRYYILEGAEYSEHAEGPHIGSLTEGTTTAFVWYTGNTKANQRGAVMCYVFVGHYLGGDWYASLVANPGWSVSKVKGAAPHQVEPLLRHANVLEGC